jgi:hypothetical protein
VALELEHRVRSRDLVAARAHLPRLEAELARLIPELELLRSRAA